MSHLRSTPHLTLSLLVPVSLHPSSVSGNRVFLKRIFAAFHVRISYYIIVNGKNNPEVRLQLIYWSLSPPPFRR